MLPEFCPCTIVELFQCLPFMGEKREEVGVSNFENAIKSRGSAFNVHPVSQTEVANVCRTIVNDTSEPFIYSRSSQGRHVQISRSLECFVRPAPQLMPKLMIFELPFLSNATWVFQTCGRPLSFHVGIRIRNSPCRTDGPREPSIGSAFFCEVYRPGKHR